jgi:hypothetical protein
MRKHDDYIFLNNPYTQKYLYKNKQGPGLIPKYFSLKYTTTQPQESNYLDTTVSVAINTFKNKKSSYLSHLSNLPQNKLRELAKNYSLKQHGTKDSLIARIMQYKNPVNNFHNKDHIWDIKTFNKRNMFKLTYPIISFPHFDSWLPKHCKLGAVMGQMYSYHNTNYLHFNNFLKNIHQLFNHLITKNNYREKTLDWLFCKFVKKKEVLYYKPAKAIIWTYFNTKGHHRPTTMSKSGRPPFT